MLSFTDADVRANGQYEYRTFHSSTFRSRDAKGPHMCMMRRVPRAKVPELVVPLELSLPGSFAPSRGTLVPKFSGKVVVKSQRHAIAMHARKQISVFYVVSNYSLCPLYIGDATIK